MNTCEKNVKLLACIFFIKNIFKNGPEMLKCIVVLTESGFAHVRLLGPTSDSF